MIGVSDYLHKKASQKKVPLSGTFELSPVCNFSCKMCYVRKTQQQINCEGKQIIPWQKWLELAKQCKEAGTLYLLLTGGEPFIYPGFKQLYTELHKMGFVIYINTNGTMIDESTVEWLKQFSPGRINITLYGTSAETYEKICGNKDGYKKAMDAIHMLKEAKIPLVINASMIPENADDMEEIILTGKNLGINTRVSTYMFPPMRRDVEEKDSRFTPQQSAAMYLRKLKGKLTPEGYLNHLKKCHIDCDCDSEQDNWGQNEEFMNCRAGRSSFWINWEGNMTACGMLDFPIKTTPFVKSFKECWMELTDTVRATPVLAGCHGCPKRHICSPCVAMIYGETGTVDEKSEYMCRLTDSILEHVKEELEMIDDES